MLRLRFIIFFISAVLAGNSGTPAGSGSSNPLGNFDTLIHCIGELGATKTRWLHGSGGFESRPAYTHKLTKAFMNKVISFSIHASHLKKLLQLAKKNKTTKSTMFRRMLQDFKPDKAFMIREEKEKSFWIGINLNDLEQDQINSFCQNQSFAARKIIEQYEG